MKEDRIHDKDKPFRDQGVHDVQGAETIRRLCTSFHERVECHNREEVSVCLQEALTCSVRELQSFAEGMKRDVAAVVAGIAGPWSNGQLEGQVNRLKMLKRQMYGRASFALLRARVLHRG